MITPRRTLRSLGLVLASAGALMAAALIPGCPEDETVYPSLFLEVSREAGTEPVRKIRILLRGPDSGELFAHDYDVPAARDIASAPVLLQIKAGERFSGEIHAWVTGLGDQGTPVAWWARTINVNAEELVSVVLKKLSAECDADGDGVPSCAVAQCCAGGMAFPTEGGDCDDQNANAHPFVDVSQGVTCETVNVDLNCDGTLECKDDDGDGYAVPEDCDPGNKAIHPDAEETCDGFDNDCDGDTDEDAPSEPCEDTNEFGTCLGEKQCKDGKYGECSAKEPTLEICDQEDNNCNDAVDEGGVCDFLQDWDNDGYSKASGDCDDYDSQFKPGAQACCPTALDGATQEELVKACDFDCDGKPEGFCELDSDGDGVPDDDDCQPNDPDQLNNDAADKCGDGKDQDCFGGDLACDAIEDKDKDGYAPKGENDDDDKVVDCIDSDPNTYPGAPELCDGVDNDCDGLTDEGNPGGGEKCPIADPAYRQGICLEHEELYDPVADPGGLSGTWGTRVCAHNLQSPGAPQWAKDQAEGQNVAVICVDYYLPPEEESTCDGLDEDCDGAVDDGFMLRLLDTGSDQKVAVGDSCGVGECANGEVVCAADADLPEDLLGLLGEAPVVVCDGWTVWTPEDHESLQDTLFCDNKDNDCDGATDGHTFTDIDKTACLHKGVCKAGEAAIQAKCVAGSWTCDYTLVADYEAAETLCDAKDNDCDGEVDVFSGAPAASSGVAELLCAEGCEVGEACDAIGECGMGTLECAGVAFGVVCTTDLGGSGYDGAGAPSHTEVCDNKDNDCNGATDDHPDAYLDPVTKSPVPMLEECHGYGTCGQANGVVQCSSASSGTHPWNGLGYTCSTNPDGGSYAGSDEVCDGEDDDCDGLTDEGMVYGSVPLKAACDGVGECSTGVVECGLDAGGAPVTTCSTNPNGSAYGGSEEVCDDKDNDCDDEVDEGLMWDRFWYTNSKEELIALGEGCIGTGLCGAKEAGKVECRSDGGVTCSTNADGTESKATTESCDGKDNDCNGVTDDDYEWGGSPLGQPCDGVGACGVGTVECNPAGNATCTTNPDGSDAENTVEKCDKIDNDCNGVTDDTDVMLLGKEDIGCKLNGVCTRQNVGTSCGDGTWNCNYQDVTDYEEGKETTCDNLDNNCDGKVDEPAFLVVPPEDKCKTAGVCAGFAASCEGGSWTCEYKTINGYTADEKAGHCDSKDNDCDGVTDEPYTAQLGTSCTRGAAGCANTGEMECTSSGGGIECSVTGAPASQSCNDGNPKTHSDHCTGGDSSQCKGTAYECQPDGLACTTDVPDGEGDCTYELQAGWCIIGGGCVPSHDSNLQGSINPLNQCEWCSPSANDTDWTKRPTGTTCNDGNSCTENDACTQFAVCEGEGFKCNDGLGCTVNNCKATGNPPPNDKECDFSELVPDTCLIAGECFGKNVANPKNQCEICDPSKNSLGWTQRSNGYDCNDGLKCTLNDKCTLKGGGKIACEGESNPCNDSNECTQDSCSETAPGFGCVNKAQPGQACTKDAFACTADVCTADGECDHPPNGQGCLIDEECIEDGTIHEESTCKACQPKKDPAAWTNLPAGSQCDDFHGCTKDDTCSAKGQCSGTPMGAADCDDQNPCTQDLCLGPGGCYNLVVANGTPCPGETPKDIDCTVDQCQSGVCTHDELEKNTCLIGGVCYEKDDEHPSYQCKVCSPSDSESKWTDKAKGTPCNRDGNGCTDDICDKGECKFSKNVSCPDPGDCKVPVCNSTGPLAHNCTIDDEANGTSCTADSLACTVDQCKSGVCNHDTIQSGKCLIAGVCRSAGDENGPNECMTCQPSEAQNAFTAVGDGTACDTDNKACTVDQCSGGLCNHDTIAGGWCHIATECVQEGNANGDNECKTCQPSKNKTKFTNVADLTACDTDGKGCTIDQCKSGACDHAQLKTGWCLIDGSCTAEDATEGDNECRTCQPLVSTTKYSSVADTTPCDSDSKECTVDQCQSGVCDHQTVAAGWCKIDDACVAGGAKDATNECMTCQPTVSKSLYKPVTNGTACTGDGKACTVDQCKTGVCMHDEIADDWCKIEGVCQPKDTEMAGNECMTCQPAVSKEAWKPVADGTPCTDDQLGCTVDACTAGTCTHEEAQAGTTCIIKGACYTDGQSNPDKTCETCQPSVSDIKFTLLSDKCLIKGICYDEDDRKGDQECEICNPSITQTAWFPAGSSVTCTDDGNPCTKDVCDDGTCSHPSQPIDTDCDLDALECNVKKCDGLGGCVQTINTGKCIIDGTCYSAGEANPSNPCETCQPGTAQQAWSPLSGVDCGTCQICTAGECVADDTQDDDCESCQKCSGGVCVNQTAAEDVKDECSSDVGCGNGLCNGSGACTYESDTTDCGTCAICNGAGLCLADLTQHSDCPSCQKCTAKETCGVQTNDEDLKNDCTADLGCGTGDCDGAGACDYEAEETDCGTCAECNGAGACVADLTQHTDCPTCQKCTGKNTCGDQADDEDLKTECSPDAGCGTGTCDGAGACDYENLGTDCGTCAKCDASGTCIADLTQHTDCGACRKCTGKNTCGDQVDTEDLKDECAPDLGCGSGNCDGSGSCDFEATDTDCGICSKCDGSGTCGADLTQHADCPTCQKCKSKGVCENQSDSQDIKDECTADAGCGTGECNGSGACDYQVEDTDCGTCARCDGAGGCVADLTQHIDCPTCEKCTAKGTCGDQTSSQDLKNECAADESCGTGNCDGAGACDYVTATTDCGVCAECDGDGACVADLTQWTDCESCQKCTGLGTCGAQTVAEDLKDECSPDAGCGSGFCDGAGACHLEDADHDCGTCAACDGSGTCAADLDQHADCSTCEKCTAKNTCGDQTSSEDLKGECGDSELCMSGNCSGAGGTCGFSPETTACDDGLTCTSASECDGAGSCDPTTIAPATCLIGGTCYLPTAQNPGNSCQVCNPGESQEAWTNKAESDPCYSGPPGTQGVGLCTAGTCSADTTPVCTGEVTPVPENTPTLCGDVMDNDCDTLTDCADPNCGGPGGC